MTYLVLFHKGYYVSSNWQCEFKYEIYMLMAHIASQSQLDYMALQYVIEAMEELCEKPSEQSNEATNQNETNNFNVDESFEQSKLLNRQVIETKKSKNIKKGVYQIFDIMSKSHINTRLWLHARKQFVQIMFNQLSDLGKYE
jgi:hypothetical protein